MSSSASHPKSSILGNLRTVPKFAIALLLVFAGTAACSGNCSSPVDENAGEETRDAGGRHVTHASIRATESATESATSVMTRQS